jgi:hypothetical protein
MTKHSEILYVHSECSFSALSQNIIWRHLFFLIQSSGNEVCCRSWRPGYHDVNQEQSATLLFSSLYIQCPFYRVPEHDIRRGRRLALGYTCHAQGHDKRHTLNWITYLICLYKWFIFQFWCFFMGQQVENFNVFHKTHVRKTPPPPRRILFPG